jgi:hypothetical protein
MDVQESRAKFIENEYWWFEQNVSFYDFEKEGCPWSFWVVVAEKDGMFLVVPCTGDNESKLVNNDHPDHFFLPCPVPVEYEWEEDWLEKKCLEKQPPRTIYAMAGFSHWRSGEELNSLSEERMRRLLPDEAAKVRARIRSLLS